MGDRPLPCRARVGLGFLRGFGGLASPGGRCRDALVPRLRGRGVQEDQRVPTALEGGVTASSAGGAAPPGARGPPSAAGRSRSLRAGGSERLAPTSGTRGGRTCRADRLGAEVLNGIAWDITGKWRPKMFEVRFVEAGVGWGRLNQDWGS